jgi:hypothetical protein
MEERRIRKYTNSELLSYIKNGQFSLAILLSCAIKKIKSKKHAKKCVCGNLFWAMGKGMLRHGIILAQIVDSFIN